MRAAAAADRVGGGEGRKKVRVVHVTAVIHESVLNREVGSPETMCLQLEHLLAMSELPNVIVQVVKGGKYFFGLEGPFYIATGDAIADAAR